MPHYTKKGGVWRNAERIYVKSDGVWRDLVEGWVKKSGAWRLFFSRNSERLLVADVFGSLSLLDLEGNIYRTQRSMYHYTQIYRNALAGSPDGSFYIYTLYDICKYSPEGNFEWEKAVNSPSGNRINAIATNSKGEVAAVTDEAHLAMNVGPLAPGQTGYTTFRKNPETPGDRADIDWISLCFDKDDNCFVGTRGGFAYKVSPSGGEIWMKNIFGGPPNNWVTAIACDSKGNAYMGGSGKKYLSKISPTGNNVWNGNLPTDMSVVDIEIDSDDNIYVAQYNGTLSKFNSQGHRLWSKNDHPDDLWSIAIDSSDNIYTACSDNILRKFSTDGVLRVTYPDVFLGYPGTSHNQVAVIGGFPDGHKPEKKSIAWTKYNSIYHNLKLIPGQSGTKKGFSVKNPGTSQPNFGYFQGASVGDVVNFGGVGSTTPGAVVKDSLLTKLYIEGGVLHIQIRVLKYAHKPSELPRLDIVVSENTSSPFNNYTNYPILDIPFERSIDTSALWYTTGRPTIDLLFSIPLSEAGSNITKLEKALDPDQYTEIDTSIVGVYYPVFYD